MAAGVDGLIVPDMPPDEAGPLKGPAAASGLQLIFLLAPTSTAERRAFVAGQSQGFVYYVSLTGITGAKLGKVSDVGANVEQIRKLSADSDRGGLRGHDARRCGCIWPVRRWSHRRKRDCQADCRASERQGWWRRFQVRADLKGAMVRQRRRVHEDSADPISSRVLVTAKRDSGWYWGGM